MRTSGLHRKIVIVHDEMSAARKLEGRLTGLGYEVPAIVGSGDEAIAVTARAAPDLVLMDMPLHGDNGIATASELQRRGNIPIVFTITETDEASLRQAEAKASFIYVVTPFTDRELRANVELALSKHDAVKAARAIEERFFTNAIDMLCFLDFNGYFKRLNPAWERTLGFTVEELMSRPFIEFVHPDDRERTLKQNAAVRGGGQALAFENRYLCKDGSFRWFHWNAAPDSTEKVIYSVARDVTATKQAAEERERTLGELRAALAEVNTLREILPICSYCRKIRDDENYWHTVEDYISRHTTSMFSHGICPTCMETRLGRELEQLEGE